MWSDLNCLDSAGPDALMDVMPQNVIAEVADIGKQEEKWSRTAEKQLGSGSSLLV